MYFIQRGDCVVKIIGRNGKNHIEKLLVESEHFGEISMIQGCKRTATVICRNYNTIAKLSYPAFREIANEYTNFKKLLERYIFKYKDANIKWIKKVLCQIEYLRDN